MISINAGNPQTYKWLMGKDKHDLVVENIKQFLSIRNRKSPKLRTVIQILMTKKTQPEVEDFKKFWTPLISPNDAIYVRPLLNWGGKINVDDICATQKRFNRYPCYALWCTLTFDKDGNVYPCCESISTRTDSDLFMGNIREKPIAQIYFDKIKKYRNAHLRNDYKALSECLRCDFYTFQPNIWIKNRIPIIDRKWI